MPDRKAGIVNAPGFGNRFQVFVKSQQTALCRQARKDQARMAATAKGGVHISAIDTR